MNTTLLSCIQVLRHVAEMTVEHVCKGYGTVSVILDEILHDMMLHGHVSFDRRLDSDCIWISFV